MTQFFKKITAIILLVSSALFSFEKEVSAEVSVANIFSDNMILQCNRLVPVWGRALPGEKVSVDFLGQHKKTSADSEGKWMVKLDEMPASNVSSRMVIKGENTTVIDGILIGEVWLCSGQSNMAMLMQQSENIKEILPSVDFPQIRFVTLPYNNKTKPQDDFVQSLWWEKSSPSSAKNFSALGYYFAKKIHKELEIPVGIIISALAGARIESWIPMESFSLEKSLGEFVQVSGDWEKQVVNGQYITEKNLLHLEAWIPRAKAALQKAVRVPFMPMFITSHLMPMRLYNGMINPLAAFSIRGVLWYQGEANIQDGFSYSVKLRSLIKGWRLNFGQGDFPFYYVQVAPYFLNSGTEIGKFWEAQRRVLNVSNTGMVVSTDASSFDDIHPQNKMVIGERLAMLALANDYGSGKTISTGPKFKDTKANGSQLEVSFTNSNGGLSTWNKKPLCCFEVAGEDNIFAPGEAKIENDKVIVSSPQVENPINVRMGWGKGDEPNLSNEDGWPASPFISSDYGLLKTEDNTDIWPREKAHVWTQPIIDIELRRVSGGCYTMGCGEWSGECAEDSIPAHEVCVDDFSMGRFEVTRKQWYAVMGSEKLKESKDPSLPITRVSWQNIETFFEKLNVITGKIYRLPTEAEWEYAARSLGKNEKYAGGNRADKMAWYAENSETSLKEVGLKFSNGIGIFDMSGNVAEWCSDWYRQDYYAASSKDNPPGPSKGPFPERVIRGGSYSNTQNEIKTTARGKLMPNSSNTNLGFRIVISEQ